MTDRRSPKEVAEGKVSTAERMVQRAKERVQRAEAEVAAAKAARKTAEDALAYAKQHPLLAAPPQEEPAGQV